MVCDIGMVAQQRPRHRHGGWRSTVRRAHAAVHPLDDMVAQGVVATPLLHELENHRGEQAHGHEAQHDKRPMPQAVELLGK